MTSDHPPTDRAAARQQALAVFLASRDEPCRSCGHNLRSVTSGTCPECGKEIALAITNSQDSRPTVAWMLAVIAYGIAVGMTGSYVLVMLLFLALDEVDRAIQAMLAVTLLTMASAGAVLALLIRRRERIWKAKRATQWRILVSVLLVAVVWFLGAAVVTRVF